MREKLGEKAEALRSRARNRVGLVILILVIFWGGTVVFFVYQPFQDVMLFIGNIILTIPAWIAGVITSQPFWIQNVAPFPYRLYLIFALTIITFWTAFLKLAGLAFVTAITPNPGEHKSEIQKALEKVPSKIDEAGAKEIRDAETRLKELREKYSKTEE